MRCLTSLQGTEFRPKSEKSVLFLEEDIETNPAIFDRLLQSIIHQHDFKQTSGIVIGRFQKESGVTKELMRQIIRSKKELQNLPVIANADFGHTSPMITFPIGGEVSLRVEKPRVKLKILKH